MSIFGIGKADTHKLNLIARDILNTKDEPVTVTCNGGFIGIQIMYDHADAKKQLSKLHKDIRDHRMTKLKEAVVTGERYREKNDEDMVSMKNDVKELARKVKALRYLQNKVEL